MDGRTTLVSKAAAWAASKGIVCTISAGNQGNVSWKYISAPADADSILSVGAVDRTGMRVSFSSIGPSFDLRIKPDVVAMGLSTIGVQPSGTIGSFNGTSFSAPLLAGLVAGILQANPQKTAQEVIEVIRKSGTQAPKPDQLLGYGIPHFDRVSQILNPILGNELPLQNLVKVYPNPASIGQKIQVKTGGIDGGILDIINMQGAIVQSFSFQQTEFDFYMAPFVSGKYYFRFTIGNQVSLVPMLLNL
jgi:subtilisin family serine protease